MKLYLARLQYTQLGVLDATNTTVNGNLNHAAEHFSLFVDEYRSLYLYFQDFTKMIRFRGQKVKNPCMDN